MMSVTGPEIWNIESGRMTSKGKSAVLDDAFQDFRSPKGSGTNTPARSRIQTPAASAAATPIASGDEAASLPAAVVQKKKKLTRNQMKAREERRRLRKLRWLTEGGPKPEDTDDE